MATYQGPNVEVNQVFEKTPTPTAIEDLPSVAVATAYDVYAKEVLGSSFGITDNDLPWGVTGVIFDKTVIGLRGYTFYPVQVFADTPFGDIQIDNDDLTIDATNVTIDKDQAYIIPGTEIVAGTGSAIMPYYKKIGSSGDVKILATDLSTVIVLGGTVVTAQIKPGQSVWTTIDGGTNWVLVGVVGRIGNDETKIHLAAPYTAAITIGDGITVGASAEATIDIADTVFDPDADYVADKVRVGDTIHLSSQSITGSLATPILATINSVINKNTLRINNVAPTTGEVDYNFLAYEEFVNITGTTIKLYYYTIKRFIGFSENYGFKTLNATVGVIITVISATSFSIPVSGSPSLTAGDLFMVTVANVAAGDDERNESDLRIFVVDTIVINGSDYDITSLSAVLQTGVVSDTAVANGNFFNAWNPRLQSDVKADFRAIRSFENKIVHRITSIEDIIDFYSKDDQISVYNELAFMLNIEFGTSGGKVLYAVNVDSSALNLSTEYSLALEELKLVDVYSHAFGTTDPGVNALIGPYVLDQSDPYEAHERIAMICFDEDDLYLQGIDSGSVATTGVITLDGGINPLTAGVKLNDIVELYKSNGDFIETVIVIATPTVSTTVATDYSGAALAAGHTFRFFTTDKTEQSIRIGAIKYGERRVKMIWPGWFQANFGQLRLFVPPYYISANRAGLDSGVIVAQSQTRGSISIPGLSNYDMKTNTYFRKSMLDEIGGGGVDIQVQDGPITQSFNSRHDLTTNMDTIEFREWSITKQVDVVAKTTRSALDPYIGRYNITNQLFQFIGTILNGTNSNLTKKGIVRRLEVLSVKQDDIVVDRINITMRVTVYIAGNYYVVDLIVVSRI